VKSIFIDRKLSALANVASDTLTGLVEGIKPSYEEYSFSFLASCPTKATALDTAKAEFFTIVAAEAFERTAEPPPPNSWVKVTCPTTFLFLGAATSTKRRGFWRAVTQVQEAMVFAVLGLQDSMHCPAVTIAEPETVSVMSTGKLGREEKSSSPLGSSG